MDAPVNRSVEYDYYTESRYPLEQEQIESYARDFLSEEAPYFRKPPGVKTREAERLAICLNDPKFGWNLVNSFVRARQRLPLTMTDACLCRAYAHLAEASWDPELDLAVALTHPRNTAQANLLWGLIISRHISFEQIATWMGLDQDVVEIFASLFFNVRARWDAPGFMAQLLYPQGKGDTLREDYLASADPGLLLLRAGYEYGAQEVARLAGLSRPTGAKVSTEQLCDQLETAILQNGVLLARQGYLNAKSSPGLAHARAILVAQRKAKESAPATTPDALGLNAISMGGGIMDLLKSSQATDVAERRQAHLQMLELEARREKTAKTE